MKLLKVKVAALSILTVLTMSAQADQNDFIIQNSKGTAISETPCVRSFMRNMTPGELESKNKTSCYGIVLKEATVKFEDGRVAQIDNLVIGHFMKKISGTAFPESKECMEKYARLFDAKFNPSAEELSQELSGAELLLPENFTIKESGPGYATAVNGHRDINLQSSNKYLGHLARLTTDVVNDSAKLIGSKDGFAIRKGDDYQCWSSAEQRTVEIDEGKYDQELDGRILQDSRKAASNVGRKTWNAVETGWNNLVNRR